MRGLRVFWVVGAASSLLVGAVVADGCATSEGTPLFGGNDGGHADTGIDAKQPPPPPSDAGFHDTGVTSFDNFVPPPPDSSLPDAGTDSGLSEAGMMDGGLVFFGTPGTPCTTLGALQAEACGRCGTQTSSCIVRPDGGVPFDAGAPVDAGDAAHDATAAHDAGATDAAPGPTLVWSEWGSCSGEIDGGCLPGTQTSQSCGLCGTQTLICEPDCELGATNCEGQVAGGCTPGSVDFTVTTACSGDAGLGGTANSCSATCQPIVGTTCEAPPSTLGISSVPTGKVNTFVNFTAANQKLLVGGGASMLPAECGGVPPVALGPSMGPYGIVTVTNSSTTQMATISVWTSQVGTVVVDTAITSYVTLPTNMASFKACTNVVQDTCDDMSDPTSCLGSYGGLMAADFNSVTIPAGGSVYIFVQDQFSDAADIAPVEVTVRTESFM